jgi:hypothetical protein
MHFAYCNVYYLRPLTKKSPCRLPQFRVEKTVLEFLKWAKIILYFKYTVTVKKYIPYNMKQAWPWMLANLKMFWLFHAHPVHQQVSWFCVLRYIGDDFFLGPNLVSFNRIVVPYEISKVNKNSCQYVRRDLMN